MPSSQPPLPSGESTSTRQGALPAWNRFDTSWTLGLFGTAVGAGILFLPMNAGLGGLWPLLIATLLIWPMTYFSHRALSRIVCASPNPGQDITGVVRNYFGENAGRVVTILYFLAIYPIVLIYGVGITNTVESLMVHQLGLEPWPRWVLAGVLILLMSSVMVAGKKVMLVVTQWLVYPLIAVLLVVTLLLIPSWSFEGFGAFPAAGDFAMSLWLMIPVLVFSFNHSPAISQFSVSLRERYGAGSVDKASSILRVVATLLVVFTMGFVWSCVLALGPEGLQDAKDANLPVLSHLANVMDMPIIAWLGPAVAIAAIASSFFGHWLGAAEGATAIVRTMVDPAEKRLSDRTLKIGVSVFLIVTTWVAGILNPSILALIESLAGPVIAAVLYLMPMYAIHRVPALARFRGRASNVFVVIAGIVAVGGILISLLR
ncbi:MAG: aromatic amino acid transport family protein [Arthrobacter sp.]|uniref:aromatic amino acid transport family protein n=1 Tax=unclassified Arthrobacter TaxID=235627 RepID=UPI00264FF1CB|nr:HAAAP family serine/threonine permease [Micrococcaceae bacterium]MDN5823916.1 HAAAP family serine/threonine permease [Micrococcaceae bacterium]MDN5878813.1 HAAAP family serine/threonine permease [Micrococcaceae bacterium]MDN5886988.1 HAAAP family serine/threonine permease [Micrococcaceae bacterium]MDN6169418.1 HAAAP family serine/threonine permease [Micrococcaceae bacterium]